MPGYAGGEQHSNLKPFRGRPRLATHPECADSDEQSGQKELQTVTKQSRRASLFGRSDAAAAVNFQAAQVGRDKRDHESGQCQAGDDPGEAPSDTAHQPEPQKQLSKGKQMSE